MQVVMNQPRRMIEISAIAAVCAAMAISCTSGKDAYLRSLPCDSETLVAVDSINIDQFDLFQACKVVKVNEDWLLLSTTKGNNHLLFLNTKTLEHFYAVRRGRGPEEIVAGSSLQRFGDDAAFYDLNNATCVRILADETIQERKAVLDTIGIFRNAAKPVYMSICGKDKFISGNLSDDGVWYSCYDDNGDVLSSIGALNVKDFPKDGDRLISRMLSSVYASNPEGTKVCVGNVFCPSLSFSRVQSGVLEEYKRYENPPEGMKAGRISTETVGAFQGMDADKDHVYVIYSGNKLRNGLLPSDECRHLIIYNWNGIPVRHYYLNRNINSVHVCGNCIYGTSTYPESCVYKFVLPENFQEKGHGKV